ncbi:MAG TPA: TRAP transporter small permease [Fodinibius sp.]|nr:TRAP transporter small permease [Fodinibius sp.]
MRKSINKAVAYILVILMVTMLICVLWQVFTRYIMGEASTVTEELARFLMIWIGLLGGAYVAGANMHVAINLLPSRLDGCKKQILQTIINLTIIAFVFVVLIIGGSQLVHITYNLGQTSAALNIPLAYVYLVLPISGLLVCYYKISDLLTDSNNSESGLTKSHEVTE